MPQEPDHGQTIATHGSRIDAYVDRYAARATGMVASEIRALFAVASRPEVVSLAGGMPYVTALPLDVVGELVADLIAKRGPVALQYGSGQGDPHLREQICDVMRLEGIEANSNDVVVTVGSQQALDLITRIFIDPGDVVLAEGPSYVGALGTFAAYQAKVVHIAMDNEGIIPESLAQTIYALQTAGNRIKFLYTIPTFQNPAGVTLNAARRQQVLEICQRSRVLIVEDNPYGLLGFDGEPMRALRADNADDVVYLGSFSKTLAPGFRVGWALAPHAIRDKLVLAMESAVLSHSSFTQLAVGQYLATQPWREQIKTFRELYRERRDTMISSLEALHARRLHLDPPRRRVLRLGDAARGSRLQGDPAPRGRRASGVRTGHRFLRRRQRRTAHAAVLLLSGARSHPRGRSPPGRGDRAGAPRARHVRDQLVSRPHRSRHPGSRPRIALPRRASRDPGTWKHGSSETRRPERRTRGTRPRHPDTRTRRLEPGTSKQMPRRRRPEAAPDATRGLRPAHRCGAVPYGDFLRRCAAIDPGPHWKTGPHAVRATGQARSEP